MATVLLAAGCTTPPAAETPRANPVGAFTAGALTDKDILTADQLRPGMTGYGLTVFAGAKPEKFDVEIISVLRNYQPRTDMILIRCAGHGLEKTGIAAGMSGSPIYIDGKLIGALAFGWQFNVQPIAGVQPIAQMLSNSGVKCSLPPASQCDLSMEPSGPAAAARSGGSVSLMGVFSKDEAVRRAADRQFAAKAKFRGDDTQLTPLAIPLTISGGSSAAMDYLRGELGDSGMVAVRSGGGSGSGSGDPRMADARIEPGSTLAVPLLSGDMDAAAIGTVTAVINDRVLAFGHPMWGEGPVNIPMATGIIHTFIPSMMSSFKMGSCGPVVGAIRRDESHSILGVMGQKPYMAPMTVKVSDWDGGEPKVYHYRVADDWFFTARMAAMAAVSSVTADHGSPLELTVSYRGAVKFNGFEPYTFEGIGIGQGALGEMAMRIALPIRGMLNNAWGKAMVESIDLEVRAVNTMRMARIEHVRAEATTLAPGEPVVIRATLEQWKKPRLEKTFTVNLPADLPDGTYSLSLLDADSYRSVMQQHDPRTYAPENMREMVEGFRRLAQPRDDNFYLVLTLPKGGLVGRDERLPSLPPSRAMILSQAGRDTYRPYTEDKVWIEPMGTVVAGSHEFQITIDRNKNKKK